MESYIGDRNLIPLIFCSPFRDRVSLFPVPMGSVQPRSSRNITTPCN
uniref:Uncharacterized protein n=1 Tax=Siphoviridae sp. ctfza2 TaxID=2825599 RepID=A0A8S5UXS5_9CAUD|nr:MAG TPA: hypothetical protein [Siphoviridae sp. ctfza2]